MEKVVAVKFKEANKAYYFSVGEMQPKVGGGVIVDTAHGIEYAKVVEEVQEIDETKLGTPLKSIVRVATEKDEEQHRYILERRGEAMRICRDKIAEHKLDMKLVNCEFAFDGSKVTFTFSADNRVDFRALVRDLAGIFHMRIELRQIGVRDETHLLGGIAPCGRVVCCASCVPETKRVSIKMAKNQGLSLNPGKVSGLCGRLMCCLAYENDYYEDAYKKMPKIPSTVNTPDGTGTAISTNMLKMQVRVKFEKDGGLAFRDYPLEKITFKKRTEPEKPDPKEEE